MNWKLLLKEVAVAYLRVVSKRCLARVRKVMKYLSLGRDSNPTLPTPKHD